MARKVMKDDIEDIKSISFDIINFCDIINTEINTTKIISEIRDCASTIIQIIKEAD
jgi:hypothetical protein